MRILGITQNREEMKEERRRRKDFSFCYLFIKDKKVWSDFYLIYGSVLFCNNLIFLVRNGGEKTAHVG